MIGILASNAKNNLWRRMKAWLIACSLYIKHLQWLMRPALERVAGKFLKVAKEAIVYFVEKADKIQESESWKSAASTWHEYCRKTWNIDSSHLSHLRGAVPYAKAILASGYDVPIIEGRIRKMRKYVPEESPLIAQTYILAEKVAKEMGQELSKAIYRRSFEVLETAQQTGGVVQVGETTHFVMDEASAIQAVKDTLLEIKKLGIQSNPVQKTKVSVTARREGDHWIIEATEALPDVIHFSLFL